MYVLILMDGVNILRRNLLNKYFITEKIFSVTLEFDLNTDLKNIIS